MNCRRIVGNGRIILAEWDAACRALQGKSNVATGCSGFREDAFVVGLVDGDDVAGAKLFLGVGAGSLAHFAAAVRAGQNFDGVARR